MPKGIETKLAIGILSGFGIFGGMAYGISELSKIKIKDKLKNRLLNFETSDNNKWNHRIVLLRKNKENLSKELAKIESEEVIDISKIKKWCKLNIENKFISDKDPTFLEIVKYCTYNIKDKIGVRVEEIWNKAKNNEKLKQTTSESKLSKTMQAIKEKLNSDDDALKNWCILTYEKPFEKENDQDLLDAQSYCLLFERA